MSFYLSFPGKVFTGLAFNQQYTLAAGTGNTVQLWDITSGTVLARTVLANTETLGEIGTIHWLNQYGWIKRCVRHKPSRSMLYCNHNFCRAHTILVSKGVNLGVLLIL